jgi:hypothetical protein
MTELSNAQNLYRIYCQIQSNPDLLMQYCAIFDFVTFADAYNNIEKHKESLKNDLAILENKEAKE